MVEVIRNGNADSESVATDIHIDPSQNKISYVCDRCDYTCEYENILDEHMKTHTGEKSFKCTECDEKYQTEDELKTHKRVHNKE